MANGYMPRKDANACLWLAAFSRGLAAAPGRYKVSAAEVAAVALAVDAFTAALLVSGDPGTRTRIAIIHKDARRQAAEATCRPIYARIKVDTTIDDATKLDIGVRPINPARTRINAPDDAPLLWLRGVTPYSHVLAFADPASPHRSAKRAGATGVQVFRCLSETRADSYAAGPSSARYVGTFTKNPMVVEYSADADFQVATYFARWIDRKGQTGPWSGPLVQGIACATPGHPSRNGGQARFGSIAA